MNDPRDPAAGRVRGLPHMTIVVTTIGNGNFVDGLRSVLEAARGRLTLIVVGDRKTPPACGAAVVPV